MITKRQQEILESIESETSREHYRAQFEMQNELGGDVAAGGIFDSPNIAGFWGEPVGGNPGYDSRRNVIRPELEVSKGLLIGGVDEALDNALDDAERAAGLGRVSPEDLAPAEPPPAPSPETVVRTVVAEVAAKERRLVAALVVLTVAIVLFAVWWLS